MAKNESKKSYKSFTDVFGDGEFYPDLPKVPFNDCLDKTYVLVEAKILKDFHTEFGVHDCALMLMQNPDDEAERFTTINSGQVVLERIRTALAKRALPLLCTPVKNTEGKNEYYNLK